MLAAITGQFYSDWYGIDNMLAMLGVYWAWTDLQAAWTPGYRNQLKLVFLPGTDPKGVLDSCTVRLAQAIQWMDFETRSPKYTECVLSVWEVPTSPVVKVFNACFNTRIHFLCVRVCVCVCV